MLAHEKLAVYQVYIEFAVETVQIVSRAESWHAFADHLERATESVGSNMVRGNAQQSVSLRETYLDNALGSLYECVACLDIASIKGLLTSQELGLNRQRLWRIRGMLMGLKKSDAMEVQQESEIYGNINFPHDELDVYNVAYKLIRLVHRLQAMEAIAVRQRNRLDVTATGILLNIAEATGKPSKADKKKFLNMAYSHSLQAALMLDLLIATAQIKAEKVADGKVLTDRIAAMLFSWCSTLGEARTNSNRNGR